MSPPRRRSNRLRGSTPTKPEHTNAHAASRLQSLVEGNEDAQPTQDAGSPTTPRTPATAQRIVPSKSAMHPSTAHHSTTLKADAGLILGFTDISPGKAQNQPSGVQQQTPSKLAVASPTFDFRFARPGKQLGPEAQRMMDELREEALRIKVKLAAEREEEKRAGADETTMGGRKIAQAKGKAGRYSDIHMAEFKKMDSIAGHPSSFRAQPSRLPPSAATNNLKRTQSKARLEDDGPERHVTFASEPSHKESDRLENTAPAKRIRQRLEDDTSSGRPTSSDGRRPTSSHARPTSRDGHAVHKQPSTPNIARAKVELSASLTTPTQASLARATASKYETQIPSLAKSPSKPSLFSVPGNDHGSALTKSPTIPDVTSTNLHTPRGMTKSKTLGNLRELTGSASKVPAKSPSKFERVKSMLRHPGFSSKKSAAASSIPTLARSPSRPNLDKSFPSVPTTPVGLSRSKSMKTVASSSEMSNKSGPSTTVPTPLKSGIPRSTSRPNLKANPTSSLHHAPKEVTYPAIGAINDRMDVDYPSLAGVRPLPDPPRQASRLPPTVPGTFTFRADQTINFGESPNGFGPSPGQSGVRTVRKSNFPSSAMPGSFPENNKENFQSPMPAVPHGIANKKRRRADSDDEEKEDERSPKKQKARVAEGPMLMAPKLQGRDMAPPPSPKKGISMSRLHMLARPKNRK